MTEIVGFTAGAFDLGPHAGHCALFEYAKKHCDHLIVGLHVNPQLERPTTKSKPLPSLPERYITLKAMRYVDGIIPYQTEEDLILLLQLLQPNKRFLGSDYENKDFTGKDLPGIENVFCSRTHPCSSTRLRELVLQNTVDKIAAEMNEPQSPEPTAKKRGRPSKKK